MKVPYFQNQTSFFAARLGIDYGCSRLSGLQLHEATAVVSLRALNLSELYDPGASGNAFILEPCDFIRSNLTANLCANCAALGVASNYIDPFVSVAKSVITGGNPDLAAEKLRNWAAVP